jgi:hypothetical protein
MHKALAEVHPWFATTAGREALEMTKEIQEITKEGSSMITKGLTTKEALGNATTESLGKATKDAIRKTEHFVTESDKLGSVYTGAKQLASTDNSMLRTIKVALARTETLYLTHTFQNNILENIGPNFSTKEVLDLYEKAIFDGDTTILPYVDETIKNPRNATELRYYTKLVQERMDELREVMGEEVGLLWMKMRFVRKNRMRNEFDAL